MPETPIVLDSLLEDSQQTLADISSPSFTDGELTHFLDEKDDIAAFRYWVEHFSYDKRYYSSKPSLYLTQVISFIDSLVSEQLNAILHHKKFQQLEASWRGVEKLIDASSLHHNVKVRLLDISWKEVNKDIERAADFDQSSLFNLIYNEEFGIAGGEPYGVILGDYQIAHRVSKEHPYDDINTLRGMTQIAAAAFAPFICAGSPALFGLDEFATLASPIDFTSVFQQQEYIPWKSLRDLPDARFLAVTIPRILMRSPYKNKTLKDSGLLFQEAVEHTNHNHYLWGNACYALGTVLIREFGDVGWFSHIRGTPRDHLGGGLVTDFPPLSYGTDSPQVAEKIITEIVITDHKERTLSELGFLCLCQCYDTPFAAFLSCPSIQRPKQYSNKGASANARIGAMLQQVLCASRFAHYIKVMIRDKVGSFTTDIECERLLQNWLNDYTTGRDDLDWDSLSRYPLQSARVHVKELPGKPGVYSSVIHLKPHYIVDQLVSELKLTTEIGQAVGGVV